MGNPRVTRSSPYGPFCDLYSRLLSPGEPASGRLVERTHEFLEYSYVVTRRDARSVLMVLGVGIIAVKEELLFSGEHQWNARSMEVGQLFLLQFAPGT